jgi:predicted nucleotidyltransferase
MENKLEQWQMLCAEAATEKDPERLMALVREISRLLDEKPERLEKPEIREAVGESSVSPPRLLA